MRNSLLFILIPCLLSGETIWNAELKEPFALTIKSPPGPLSLGEMLNVEIEYQLPSSYEMDQEALVDQLMWSGNPLAPHWSLIESQINRLSDQEGVVKEQVTFTIAPLSLGRLELSFLTALFQPKEKGEPPLEVPTAAFSFDVSPSQPQPSLDFAPLMPLDPQFPLGLTESNQRMWIDDPKEVEKARDQIRYDLQTRTLPWLTLLCLIGCSGIGWFFYLIYDRRSQSIEDDKKIVSSKEKIQQEIDNLHKCPHSEEDFSSYYLKLSSLLLDAIEVKSGWRTKELTTMELERALRDDPIFTQEEIEALLAIFKELDQVKFAGIKPNQAETEKLSWQIQERVKSYLKE